MPLGRRRRVNPDGTVRVACRVCGRIIVANSTIKIATAVCYSCDTGNPQPQQIPIDPKGMPRPDWVPESQGDLLDAIFAEQGTLEHKRKKKWSPMNLVEGAFKALGFSQHKKAELDQAQVKYDTIDEETSKQVAKRKQRKPIFGGKIED